MSRKACRVSIVTLGSALWGPRENGTAASERRPLSSYLQHPAALFVDENLVVIHNEAWEITLGTSFKQGGEQKGVLFEQATATLQSAIEKNVDCDLAIHHLAESTREDLESCTVLQSPVSFEHSKGVIVQLLCEHKESLPVEDPSDGRNMALDRQPFFQKFAEMLPTGLAILDHDVEALFVNNHFHELTVHGGTDRSFKKWPKTIHPDDFDRVMSGYKEAFEARSNFSTEFRASGMNYPWRLFLTRPLGNDSLEQTSLRSKRGFICAVIDITDTKAAELSQKKAATEAQDRKKQQERFIDMISHGVYLGGPPTSGFTNQEC